ncbi:mitochondrial ribosomal protein S5 [Scheffersomyces coipomensis]|uniref:mitochondrial ribosomal protein S5 n=1 Tax=Scheffersomyces coipomensis TaxID=1788519 RepID=UPI00315D744D
MIRSTIHHTPAGYSGSSIIRRFLSSSSRINQDASKSSSNKEQSSSSSSKSNNNNNSTNIPTSDNKVTDHVQFLKQYYTPELLQSIQITESLIDPNDVLQLKMRGFRGNSKVKPTDEFSDYSTNDPIWDEPIVYPNQASKRTPYPAIPNARAADRSDLHLRFVDKTTNEKKVTSLRTTRQIADDLSKLTGLDARYIRNLYIRPIIMKRVSLKTSKGNIPNFFVLTVAGDRNGTIGLGIGKSRDGIRTAAVKAHWNAVKNLTPIPRYEDRTILGDFEYKYHAVKLFMKSAPAGFGLRVNQNIFEICQAAGIKDLRGKVYKSRNPLLVAKGFVEALTKQRSIEDLAAGRGKKIVDLRKVYYSH